MLRGTNQKRMVSSVWRRKYCLRNLECFCGRALSNCRNKSHAPDPTSGAYSWRRRAEIAPAALLACVEPGQGEHRYSTQCGVPEVVTVPCSSCAHPGVTKGAVTVSCLGCEREICSFMAGWLSPHP